MKAGKFVLYGLAGLVLAGCVGRCSPEQQAAPWPERYAAMDIPEATPRTAEQALADFRLPDDIQIELVAAEPLIGDPVAMDWDEFGHLYVVEMRGFMLDTHGRDETKPLGRVVRLADNDGDGRMDHSDVFLDNLVNPRAVVVVNEGIVVAEPPNLWLCPQPASGAQCRNKVRLGDYGGGNADDVEHDENRLLQGVDGWLYSAKSGVKRRIVNSQLVTRPTAFRGQWGLSQDPAGRLYSNNNSTLLSADFYPAEFLQSFTAPALGLDAGAGLGELLLDDQQVHPIRVNPGVNRAYSNGVLRDDGRLAVATAASGLQVYNGSQLPPSWQGNAFVPEPAGNLVAQLAVATDGVAMTAQHITYADKQWGERDFLTSTDERFRPVDMRTGPDGALYVIDMYRGVIQHRQFITEELREQAIERGLVEPVGLGRIYRLRSRTAAAAAPADFSTTKGLLKALDHVDDWPRQTASRRLRQPSHRQAVATLSLPALRPAAQVQALWLKHDTKTLDATDIGQMLDAGGPARLNALQLAHHHWPPARLLAWQRKTEALTELEQVYLLAGLLQHKSNQPALLAARNLLQQNINSPYFRRVYLAGVAETAPQELVQWMSSSMKPSDGYDKMLRNLSMAALLYAQAAQDQISPEALQIFDWYDAHGSTLPSWKQQSWLQGLGQLARADNFTRLQLPAEPSFVSRIDKLAAGQPELAEAMTNARSVFTWPGDEFVPGLAPLTPEQQQQVAVGQALYLGSCAACHQATGEGLAGLAPPLVGSQWVSGPPEWLTRIVLNGISGPIDVAGQQWNGVMPGHGHLPAFTDTAVAGLLTYIRRSWGNRATPISTEMVANTRSERTTPWTVSELEQIPVTSPYAKYEGRYKIPFMPISMQVTAKSASIVLDTPQGKLEVSPNTNGVFEVADQGFSFYFAEEDGDMQLRLTRGTDEITMKRK